MPTANELKEKARKERTDEVQYHTMRDGAASVLDAIAACPGDRALDLRELLRAEVESALSDAFQDGYAARQVEEEEEAYLEDDDGKGKTQM